MGLAFFGGILGFIWILRILINQNLKKKFLNRINWWFYLFLIIWAVTGLLAITKGVRFILMVIPPFVISMGILVGIIVEYLNDAKVSRRWEILQKRKYLISVLSILLVIIIAIPAIISVYASCYSLVPGANDDMWVASQWINDSTNISNDTVIISSWSWGHLYTAIANRPVSLDGRMGYIETLPVRSYDNSYVYLEKSPSTSRNTG